MSDFRKSFIVRVLGQFEPGKSGPGDTEDWQRGDIAECIVERLYLNGDLRRPFEGIALGSRFKVTSTGLVQHRVLGQLFMLRFRRFPRKQFYAACFRKVRPQADEAIAADAAFVDHLRRTPQKLPALPRELEETA